MSQMVVSQRAVIRQARGAFSSPFSSRDPKDHLQAMANKLEADLEGVLHAQKTVNGQGGEPPSEEGKMVMDDLGDQAGGQVIDLDQGPVLDVEDFNSKWLVWRSFVALQRSHYKKPVIVPVVDREQVVPAVLNSVGGLNILGKHQYPLFHPLKVEGFDQEVVQDEGGASHEVLSLFFEQVKDLSVEMRAGRVRAGLSWSLKLFEAEEEGAAYLPTQVKDPSLLRDVCASQEIRERYFQVGRVMAKAIIGKKGPMSGRAENDIDSINVL